MPEIQYSKGWFRAHRRSVGSLDNGAARKLHDKRKLYTVVVFEANRPFAFMEIRLEVGFVGVSFLDAHLRELLSFAFSARGLDGRSAPPGKCFLKSVILSQFDDDTDKAAFGTSFDYDFDGNCQVIRENLRTREKFESHHRVDVSDHWETFPAFGEYEPFLRRERWSRIEVIQ